MPNVLMLQNLPENVVGVVAMTLPSDEEYSRLRDSISSAALAGRGRNRLVFALGPMVMPEEARTLWADSKDGLKYIVPWEKVAVVADFSWLPSSSRAFGSAGVGQIRVYPRKRFSEAVEWARN